MLGGMSEMRMKLDCISCLQRQALEAARFVTDDEEVQERVMRRVIEELRGADWTATPPEIAHGVHRIVKEETGALDPYKDIKKRDNRAVLDILPDMKERVTSSDRPLHTAALLTIAGNIMDSGAVSEFDLMGTVDEVLKRGFDVDDFEAFEKALYSASSVLYLADNCGEIVFDRLLLETVLEDHEFDRIVFAVKGVPIINDATEEDAKEVGITDLPNVELLRIGTGDPGSGMERGSEEFEGLMEEMDMIISKGQGNYEGLSSYPGIFFLLMAKCSVLASDLGVEKGDIILKRSG